MYSGDVSGLTARHQIRNRPHGAEDSIGLTHRYTQHHLPPNTRRGEQPPGMLLPRWNRQGRQQRWLHRGARRNRRDVLLEEGIRICVKVLEFDADGKQRAMRA